MRLLFCSDILNPREPDSAYHAEVEASKQLNIPFDLINYEALVYENDAAKAVRHITAGKQSEAIYRGWMLKPHQYERLTQALLNQNITLINSPEQYVHCHHLPESYPIIEGLTPPSVWMKTAQEIDFDQVMALLKVFDSKPIIVKDFVKSQKYYWDEACFIPSASDRVSVERVVRRFMELQGDDLNEGLVFREFINFEPLIAHAKSGMPLTKEFRVFCAEGKPIYTTRYWSEGDYANSLPIVDQFVDIIARIESHFFSMDIAKQLDSGWMIVELGDGQVAGLPETANPIEFYSALADTYR